MDLYNSDIQGVKTKSRILSRHSRCQDKLQDLRFPVTDLASKNVKTGKLIAGIPQLEINELHIHAVEKITETKNHVV